MATAASYIFGPFRLDAKTDTLFRGGDPVSLGHRAVALLRVLVERRGVPVSKDALMEAAWPGLSVEESNLAVQIAALRRVFSEEPGGEPFSLGHRAVALLRVLVERRGAPLSKDAHLTCLARICRGGTG